MSPIHTVEKLLLMLLGDNDNKNTIKFDFNT